MRERWKYDKYDYHDEDGNKTKFSKWKSVLTWEFYIRFIKTRFVPCSKCQEKINIQYEKTVSMGFIPEEMFPRDIFARFLCPECKCMMGKIMLNTEEVILGNNAYEPLLELTRRWIDDDMHPVDITREEFLDAMHR